MWEKINAYRILVGKPERNRPPGRGNNSKIDFRAIGFLRIDWIHLAQDRDL
jgi:hypothetical protein